MSECPKLVWAMAMLLFLCLISLAAASNIKSVEYEYNGGGCGCSNRLNYQANLPMPIYELSSPSEYDYRLAEPRPKLAQPQITSYRLDFVAEEPLKQKPDTEDLYAKVDRITVYKDSQDGRSSANQIIASRPRVSGFERLSSPSARPLYRYVYKKVQPCRSQRRGQYNPEARYQFAVVSPVDPLRSLDSKNIRHKREVHVSEFLQERKQKKAQSPGRLLKAYHTKLPGKPQTALKGQVTRRYQKPLNRQKPQKRQSTINYHTSVKRQTAKYQTSLYRQTPLKSEAHLRYQMPLKREPSLKRQASLKRQISLTRETPNKRQIPLTRQRLLNLRKPLKRWPALKPHTQFKRQKPLKRGSILNHQASFKRQAPPKHLTSLKRRTPPKRQAPFKRFGEMLQAQMDRLKLQNPLLPPTVKRSKLVKRDIKAEYDLLQREREQLDLTLPEIIQFMPETLQPNFQRGQCNIGCASYKKSDQQPESSSDSEESQEAEEKANEQLSNNNNNAQRTETATNNNNKSNVNERFYFYLLPPSENAIISNNFDSRSISTDYEAGTTHRNANNAALAPIFSLQIPSFNSQNDDRAQQRKQRHIYGTGAIIQQAVHNDNGKQPIYDGYQPDSNDLQHEENLHSMNYAPMPVSWNQYPDNLNSSPRTQHAPLPSRLGIYKGDLDKFIVDTLQRHPDFMEASRHYGGALVDPEHWQIAETKDLLKKLIAGRLHLWFGN